MKRKQLVLELFYGKEQNHERWLVNIHTHIHKKNCIIIIKHDYGEVQGVDSKIYLVSVQ